MRLWRGRLHQLVRPPPSAPSSPFARGAALQEDGWTALIKAAFRGHEEVVGLLLEGGADREAKDRWGDSALDRARRKGHDGVVRLLEVRGRRGVGEGCLRAAHEWSMSACDVADGPCLMTASRLLPIASDLLPRTSYLLARPRPTSYCLTHTSHLAPST